MLEIVGVDTTIEQMTRIAQEGERQRIARELHDGAVQTLSALVAELDYFQARGLSAKDENRTELLEKVQAWQSLARESLTSLRESLGGLRASSDLENGLPHAIEDLLRKMQDAGYLVEFECADWPAWLSAEYASHIYAMTRESLINISKHAHASRVQIRMYSFEERLYVGITDDGIGIKQNAPMPSEGNGYSQGILGMRERAALLGGSVTIESREGKGTRVDIELPLSNF